MKDLWKNGIVILLIIGGLYIIFLRECKTEKCPPEGQVLVPQSSWDSILALADKPPTIHIDTIKGDIVYIPATPLPMPEPEPSDTTINNYSDSLIKEDINVWYNFKVKGTLEWRDWNYRPITIKETDSIPYPVYIKGDPYEVKVPQNGVYMYGMFGGNFKSNLFGGGIDFITKRNTEIGYVFQRFGDQDFHSVKLGFKIKFKKQ